MGDGPKVCGEDAAVTLASYNNLALVDETDVPDEEAIEVAAHADWFRLDNAEVSAEYTVKAIPDRTTNYNLGIVVYGPDLARFASDERAEDNYRAEVSFEAGSAGPYLFKMYQLTPK
jgi:hypothetical protein